MVDTYHPTGLKAACLGLAALLVISCSGDKTNPLASFQPEIYNVPNNFQFQATDLKNVSTTVSYGWQNDGQQATVDHSSAVSGGSAYVDIYDADDSLVYSHALVPSIQETTQVGTAGTWRIVVRIDHCSGTLNFRVQKL